MPGWVVSCMAWYGMVWYGMVWYGMHRYLVLVQQRAAPTLICASKLQVRKHMSADRDVLPEYGHPPIL